MKRYLKLTLCHAALWAWNASPVIAQQTNSTLAPEGGAYSSAVSTVELPLDAISIQIQEALRILQRDGIDPAIEYLSKASDFLSATGRFVEGTTDYFSGTNELVSGTGAFIDDASNWVASTARDATTSTVDAVEDVASRAGGLLSDIAFLPAIAAKSLADRIHTEEFDEFGKLVNESGFALMDVSVGMSLFPELKFFFQHMHDLTPEESETYRAKVEEHIANLDKSVGFAEAVILRALVRAGEYSAGADLSSVVVSLLPLPGLTLKFDPFGYHEDKYNYVAEAHESLGRTLTAEQELARRLIYLEQQILNLTGEPNPVDTQAAQTAGAPEPDAGTTPSE